ncbi:hypothetical protein AAMO2058_001495500 [Amorphochlora amoebiformis]
MRSLREVQALGLIIRSCTSTHIRLGSRTRICYANTIDSYSAAHHAHYYLPFCGVRAKSSRSLCRPSSETAQVETSIQLESYNLQARLPSHH